MRVRNRMRALAALCAAAVMFMVATPASAVLPTVSVVDANVMTQNLYIGADLSRILPPVNDPPAAVFQTILKSNFAERFATFAAEVDAENPDLIGLQEVTRFEFLDAQGNFLQAIDYLDIVLGNLALQGEFFAKSSEVKNADVTLPIPPEVFPPAVFVRVIDRDVIIHNTATTKVSDPMSANFSTNFAFPLGEDVIEFTRGYTSVVASVDGGAPFRFVNTHLEVQGAPCLTQTGLVICQEVQAAELVEKLADESLPVVLLGDFNAEPGEPTYKTIVEGGYVDTWNSDDPGFTCCEDELLDNKESNLTQRIDHIFHGTANASLISATTETVTAKTPSGLWYSDHAGVVADLRLLATDICAGLTPTIEGTEGDDVIIGTDGDDIIFSYGGNDVINAKLGNDVICSGDGNDVISSSGGDDRIDVGSGNDVVTAGSGDDLVLGVFGNNTVTGGTGDDRIVTGQGDDVVAGNDGDDVIDVGDGVNTVEAGSGDDVVTGGTDADRINGGPGRDNVDAGAGIDTCISAEISVGCEL